MMRNACFHFNELGERIAKLATYEPVEVQDFGQITDHLRGIYGIYLRLLKKKPKDHNS